MTHFFQIIIMFQVKSILNTKFGSTTSLTTDTSGRTCPKGCLWDNARWHDPSLGRFAQADSIVPGGVLGLDRYAYVNNNPLRYNDPTGHMCSDPEDPTPTCDGGGTPPPSTNNGGSSSGSGGGDDIDDDNGSDTGPDLCKMIGECEGGAKGLYSPTSSEITCDDYIVGCQRYGDILILKYNNETITINLSNVTNSTDLIAIADFIRFADQRKNSWDDFVNNSGIVVASTAGLVIGSAMALGGGGTPITWGGGGIAGASLLGVVIGVKATIESKQSYNEAINTLPEVWSDLQHLNNP